MAIYVRVVTPANVSHQGCHLSERVTGGHVGQREGSRRGTLAQLARALPQHRAQAVHAGLHRARDAAGPQRRHATAVLPPGMMTY